MTKHTRSSQVSLAALLLAGLSAACGSDPLAGTDQAGPTGGAQTTTTGGTTSASGGNGGVQSCSAGASSCSGTGGATATGAVTSFTVLESPERAVDILFLVDNSPSMDPKQAALAANFPRMIQALQAVPGGLPDVHIGVISSDMGAGSEGIGGNCNVPLGDKGLLWGNVSTTNAFTTASQDCYAQAPVRATFAPNSCWALAQDPPITNGCGLASGARWIEDIQNPNGIGRQQNYTGNLTDVFSCMAKAVGVNGCGYEQQLQSLRVALNPQPGINDANVGFIRPKAYLAIVLITDEDDCSANPNDVTNDGMFLQRPMGETASMKCAARGDLCNGAEIPNYDAVNGYSGTGFSTPLSNCAPKDQRTRPDPAYMPLIPVQDMIDSVNNVHVVVQGLDVPKIPEQILVSGIFGWPENGDPSTVNFTIGVDATSLPPPQNTYWDYMPICTIPSQKSADGNIYKAYGGLRLKKFVDAFKNGTDTNVFSICNNDFTNAMTQIGNAIVKVMPPACVRYPLMDTDPNTPGIQPECQVLDKVSCDMPGAGMCLSSGYVENPLPQCIDPTTQQPVDPANPQTANVPDAARPCWYLYYDTDPVVGCADAPNGQRIAALRVNGTVAPTNSLLALTCLTCPASNPDCSAAGH